MLIICSVRLVMVSMASNGNLISVQYGYILLYGYIYIYIYI